MQQRRLERLVDQLKILPVQLPGLGLKPQAVKRWRPAIERWQHILELEIAEQQKTSQRELLNPFQFGNPLRPDPAAIFKGRQDFTDRLVRSILDRNRPTLVLHSPRRAGKTSFLLNLPRLLPSDLVPIYLDIQQGSMTASEGDFCYGLVRAIDRDTRSQGLQLPPIPSRSDFAQQPYPTLEDWLDLALPQLGDRRLLLNLDEAEVTAGQQFLKALAQGNTLSVTDEISIAAHRRLRRYHAIERIDGDIDKIEIPLIEQWVRERSIET